MSDSADMKTCTIQIIRKDKKVFVSPVSRVGRFRLELEYNNEYKLIFKGNGTSKIIEVNTEIPAMLIKQEGNLPHFLMAVRLFSDDLEYTPDVQEIAFSQENNCFSRVKTSFDYELVDRGSSVTHSGNHNEVNKSRLQGYQIF